MCVLSALRIRLSAQSNKDYPGSVPEEDEHREHVEKAPEEFEINMLRCIYCGYCQEVCPEEAIFLQDEYSTSGYSRKK